MTDSGRTQTHTHPRPPTPASQCLTPHPTSGYPRHSFKSTRWTWCETMVWSTSGSCARPGCPQSSSGAHRTDAITSYVALTANLLSCRSQISRRRTQLLLLFSRDIRLRKGRPRYAGWAEVVVERERRKASCITFESRVRPRSVLVRNCMHGVVPIRRCHESK